MSLVGAGRKFAAILRRDFRDSLRRRAGFIVQGGTMAAELAAFYFFARAIGAHYRPNGMDYYPYLLVGAAMFSFYISGANDFVSMLKEAQITGTLEVMMNTSTSPPMMIALSSCSIFSGRTLRLVAFLAGGAVPVAHLFHPNLPAAALVIALSVLVAVSLGMIAASAQLLLHRGDAVIRLFWIVGWLLSGMAFPISGLPSGLRQVAGLVPATYSIQALRAALLQDGTWGPVTRPAILLASGAAVLLPLSAIVLTVVVNRARADGTLSFY
jgi:ABC-2 type transport system permease protein